MVPLSSIETTLRAVTQSHNSYGNRRLTEVTATLSRVTELRKIAEMDIEYAGANANLFTLLKVESSEVYTHSPILADLLDPRGHHQHGLLFLTAFLEMVFNNSGAVVDAVASPFAIGAADQWMVRRERHKIDIIIQNRILGILVFVENKIYSGEQPDQLKRYGEILDSRKDIYRHRRLVYLTPSWNVAPPSREPDVHLRYQPHIVDWLKHCLLSVRSSRVRNNVEQYVEIITAL